MFTGVPADWGLYLKKRLGRRTKGVLQLQKVRAHCTTKGRILVRLKLSERVLLYDVTHVRLERYQVVICTAKENEDDDEQ